MGKGAFLKEDGRGDCGGHRGQEGTVSMADHGERESQGIFFVCLYLNFSWNNCFGF